MTQPGEVPALSPAEQRVWRAFVRLLLVAPRALDADLVEDSRLTFAEYHVLAHLSEQPGRAMRMSELSALSTLSPSGVTGVVQRLASRGFIDRRGREEQAVLTEAGLGQLTDAWPAHLASVRARVMDHLAELDQDALVSALTAISAACAD